MKRILHLLMTACAALLLLWGCGSKEPIKPEATLTASPESLSFEAVSHQTKMITITTEGAWTASASDSWVHIDKTSGNGNGSVSVTVDENTSPSARNASVVISGVKSATISVSQEGSDIRYLSASPASFDGNKLSSTTYQLLIYSFADSDGDGIGDFKGIISKLDYLDGLGVTGIWLSPAHPSDSYHAYDVTDYYSVNPLYGTEEDFKDLIEAAHAKGIKIYMDYVLNHSGKGNAWFQQALADPESPYRDYYFFSSNPSADYSSFPMLKGTTYKQGEWKQATSGSPKLTVTKTNEPVTSGSSDWNLYFWTDSGSKEIRFKDRGDGTYYLVMDINGSCGMLVRKYMNWNAGSKFGAVGDGALKEGETIDLVGEGHDITFNGSGRYKIELTNVATETLYYMGCFSDWMPDLNYGDVSKAETNACFQDLAASADKWINMGVDGLRLDAVKHICGGIESYNNNSNQTLLKKWYDHCNATYKAAGHDDDIFMVAEAWDGHNQEKNYYKGINSCFEFEYFGALTKALGGNGSSYVSSVMTYVSDHTAVRSDAITSLFMTNHDQDRAAESLGKNLTKERQAAAMLLTSPGKPFVYQGEELGYWGTKSNGDEYVRTPMMWDKAGSDCAKKGINNKVDNNMLKSSISVEAQTEDPESLLNTYRTFSRLRNTYSALADGEMSTVSGITDSKVAAWYMTKGSEKMLVVSNCSTSSVTVNVSDDMSKCVGLLGEGSYDGNKLTLSGNTLVVFKVK